MYATSNDTIPPFREDAMRVGFSFAEDVGRGSNCTRRQVGAILLDPHGLVKAVGYNHVRTTLPDCSYVCPRASKTYEEVPTRASYREPGQECYAVHAEVDALVERQGASVQGWWILVTNRPCAECQALLDSVGVVAIWKEVG